MGVSGTGIFASDIACDIRDQYRELIEDGIDDQEATCQTLEKYQQYFEDPEDRTTAMVALAVAQSKIGRLDPSIRDRALALIDQGGDLEIWEKESPRDVGKRRAALEKARAQLTGPQPARKRLRPPRKVLHGLVAGDVLALDLPGGPVLLRTVYVHSTRYGEDPILEELDFTGAEVPPADVIRQVPAKKKDCVFPYRGSRFGTMLDAKNAGWKEAGFRKVANIPARKGDEVPGDSGSSIFWSALAKLHRRHRDGDPIDV